MGHPLNLPELADDALQALLGLGIFAFDMPLGAKYALQVNSKGGGLCVYVERVCVCV